MSAPTIGLAVRRDASGRARVVLVDPSRTATPGRSGRAAVVAAANGPTARSGRSIPAGQTERPATSAQPRAHFANPNLSAYSRPVLTADGRFYGHVTTHLRMGALIARPPLNTTGYVLHGQIDTDDGRVDVGNISLAAAGVGAFDNTATVVADVTVGEDAHGVWFSGSVRDLDAERRRRLAAADVIGDWRRINKGRVELVGLLAGDPAVSVSIAASGALVASGRPADVRVEPGDVPYVGRALNHQRPRHPHDRISSATYAAAFDHLVARGGVDRSMLTSLVEAMEAAADLERTVAAGGDLVLADRTATGLHSVTYRPCPLGPDPARPGLVAAAAFVDAATESETCPRCHWTHRRDD